jgi:hypothetical protein
MHSIAFTSGRCVDGWVVGWVGVWVGWVVGWVGVWVGWVSVLVMGARRNANHLDQQEAPSFH